MVAVPFLTEFDPAYGRCVQVAPGIHRVVARNPSKYTHWGTGTYLIGDDEVAIVDPGPDDTDHVAAVLAAVDGRPVSHLLITHTHADHSPATAALQEATGAPSYGFGPHPADDRDREGGEEHGDLAFRPDVTVRDGDLLSSAELDLQCLHTPGHISNHVCYAERRRSVLFSGDHVMGWSTTVISPPAGDLDDYLANLARLVDREESVYLPTHGPPITDPVPFVRALIAHRHERERQIVAQLTDAPRSVADLVAVLYRDVRPELHEPAARSVRAHLISLERRGAVEPLDRERFALRDRFVSGPGPTAGR